MSMSKLLTLLFLLPTLAPARAAQSPETPPAPETASEAAVEPLLARVAVLGASMSAGFDLLRTYRAEIDLSHVLRAALLDPDCDVRSFANTMLFTQPFALGAQQVQQAAELSPTLAIALDFPFWFGYGAGLGEDARLELLEVGLGLLDRLDVPIVVGDFPDMRAATDVVSAYGFAMLRPAQVPAPETLARLNARLAEWAGAKSSRVLVSLASFHQALSRGDTVEVRRDRWTGEDLRRLLLEDQLHPSVEGNVALVLLALDALAKAELGLAEEDVAWSAEEVRGRLDEATKEAREKALENERRREERQRAREERQREREKERSEPPGPLAA